MTDAYGKKLDPYRSAKTPNAIKAPRHTLCITNNPSSALPGNELYVKFPPLGPDDLIVPGTSKLSFKINLQSSTDPNRTMVNNIGRAIVEKVVVKLNGREVFSMNNPSVLNVYKDLWKSENWRKNNAFQGIEHENVTKLRVGAADASDSNGKQNAVAKALGSRYWIPLDFPLLEDHGPYSQSALADQLVFEIKFKPAAEIMLTSDTSASYSLSDILLEFETVTDPQLARLVKNQYQNKMVIFYERIHEEKYQKNKKDTLWNFNFNKPARSLRGILMLFKKPQTDYAHDPEKFYNPKITKVLCSVQGKPHQVYASGMEARHHFPEIKKLFEKGVVLDEYLTTKYGLWLDFRTSDDLSLHGSGRGLEGFDSGVSLTIEKEKESDGMLDVYIYYVCDAQLNIEGQRLKNTLH